MKNPDELVSKRRAAHWLDGLRSGDDAASQELWNRYFARLVTVARARLGSFAPDVSGEDVALSALNSVMSGVRHDRFPRLSDRSELWPLLVTITARKAISQLRRRSAKKRSGPIEYRFEDIRDYIGVEPTPEFVVEMEDELERLSVALDDPVLRKIVDLKLASYSNAEIADVLGCSGRTVIRKLKRIRQEWRLRAELDGSTKGSLL